MKINKLKKIGKNKYKVYFDNTELVLYEDVILKNDLLLKSNIDLYDVDRIVEDNKYYEAYYLALGYIDIKMRNKNEIISYLKKKDFNDELIDFTINKLNELGLLNDEKYINAYINDKIYLSNDGPYKIKRSLLDIDCNEELIDKYLDKIEESIWKEKLDKLINKKLITMKNKSYYMIINKLKNDMFNMGYDKYMIEELLSNIEYDNSSINKEFEKASKKYKNDKSKIVNYLLRKGYSYEEINSLFNE